MAQATVHPFPARMAPELALDRLKKLPSGSIVLDPMAGSGTVLRQAANCGHRAIGFDMDPLAVLMSRVATTPSRSIEQIDQLAQTLVEKASALDGRKVHLGWIDRDRETSDFVKYWFAPPQRLALRKLAKFLNEDEELCTQQAERNALFLAMSRIIVTKEQRASLARDTSRSRPHRVTKTNDFDIFSEFVRSAKRLKNILLQDPPMGSVEVNTGDARNMKGVKSGSIDAVITSPPYLNAIDYLRGHKLSLVWMGYSAAEIREIRSHSIGAERGPDSDERDAIIDAILESVGEVNCMPPRYQGMIQRYTNDLFAFTKELARVTRVDGQATFVVGDSCLRGVFIRNSLGLAKAAELNGFRLIEQSERDLPARNRSIPVMDDQRNALSKRIRKEHVMQFERVAA